MRSSSELAYIIYSIAIVLDLSRCMAYLVHCSLCDHMQSALGGHSIGIIKSRKRVLLCCLRIVILAAKLHYQGLADSSVTRVAITGW